MLTEGTELCLVNVFNQLEYEKMDKILIQDSSPLSQYETAKLTPKHLSQVC